MLKMKFFVGRTHAADHQAIGYRLHTLGEDAHRNWSQVVSGHFFNLPESAPLCHAKLYAAIAVMRTVFIRPYTALMRGQAETINSGSRAMLIVQLIAQTFVEPVREAGEDVGVMACQAKPPRRGRSNNGTEGNRRRALARRHPPLSR